ncbi:MAG TPA: DUF3540 domain-containing protein [Rhodocyclaceae bacterium]|nr:DUF3540 domain-containing protein [Rhodocyclaceae bacterium]
MSLDRNDIRVSFDLPPAEEAAADAPPRAIHWTDAAVKVLLGEDRYLLDNGRLARRAPSCLLQPQAGDRVMALAVGDETHIVHILVRSREATAQLSVSGADTVALRQDEIQLDARRRLRLRSLGDTEVTAATGTLSLQGRNLFAHAVDSLVQQSSHWIARMGHALIEASELLRAHGRQALVTADQDIKIDAERISMG